MKHLFLVVILCMLVVRAGGQIRTWQQSLIDSSLSLLYIGIDNEIRIEHLPAGAEVRLLKGTVTSIPRDAVYRPGQFDIRVSIPGTDTLSVFSKGKRIYSKVFHVALINDLKARLGAIRGNVASVSQILVDPMLHVYIDSCFLKVLCEVGAFEVAYKTKLPDLIPTTIYGNRIDYDASALAIVRQLKPGDRLILNDIRVMCAGARIRNLGSLVYSIR